MLTTISRAENCMNSENKDIQEKTYFNQIQCIHAHTWYSDGGVAYLLSRKLNIRFIVTIRNTDISIFQEKLTYLRPFVRKILSQAKKIILISASCEERVLSQSSLSIIKIPLQDKLKIISNSFIFFLAIVKPT